MIVEVTYIFTVKVWWHITKKASTDLLFAKRMICFTFIISYYVAFSLNLLELFIHPCINLQVKYIWVNSRRYTISPLCSTYDFNNVVLLQNAFSGTKGDSSQSFYQYEEKVVCDDNICFTHIFSYVASVTVKRTEYLFVG